ncbi:MAG: DUF2922 domain-containing protein [Syntrophomonadaceae bacterium]|nr:DUF2922 domain-containing protein [Syntrophomonadaceae bacterium]
MATVNKLEMAFGTQLDGTYKITIYEAKTTLTGEDVVDVMEEIIRTNIFAGTGGDLVSIKGANLITVTPLDLTPAA